MLDILSEYVHNANFNQMCPVGAELFRADGLKDKHDETDSRFSQFYERA